ncbi:TetR/AcrR family transcriptional regulator [Rhodococcus sp. HNM0569]|uniref:TetR/AcrR family transcriptional regulator n=1 Tax=Rhodococcus sp. HNM0569 TaxID=2716340 RepID=UPI0019820A6E|nr:TetR/AcrR family transcriptional regulator [Rhodococcus sp. HNM0569]
MRDKKKAATRAALSEATVRLSRQFGIDHVTADAIAAEAGVSTRTFHNYFSNKEEAVLTALEDNVRSWVDTLRARPADEPIWDSIEAVVVDMLNDPEKRIDETVDMLQGLQSSPVLLAKQTDELQSRISRLLGEAIAERTGTNAETDLYPHVLHHAVGGACKAALDLWISGRSGASGPDELVRRAFAQLKSGLPQP